MTIQSNQQRSWRACLLHTTAVVLNNTLCFQGSRVTPQHCHHTQNKQVRWCVCWLVWLGHCTEHAYFKTHLVLHNYTFMPISKIIIKLKITPQTNISYKYKWEFSEPNTSEILAGFSNVVKRLLALTKCIVPWEHKACLTPRSGQHNTWHWQNKKKKKDTTWSPLWAQEGIYTTGFVSSKRKEAYSQLAGERKRERGGSGRDRRRGQRKRNEGGEKGRKLFFSVIEVK